VLLYDPEDVERQHGMSAASRLSRRDIQSVLRALRQLQRKKSRDDAVVATSGEILAEDEEGRFRRDTATDDTRVRTAIAWLEEAGLVRREENAVQVLPRSCASGISPKPRPSLPPACPPPRIATST